MYNVYWCDESKYFRVTVVWSLWQIRKIVKIMAAGCQSPMEVHPRTIESSHNSKAMVPLAGIHWHPEYANDIEETLREAERKRLKIDLKSPQLSCRSDMIAFIRKSAAKHSFSRTTIHLSVYLFDTFSDNHRIAMENLRMIALVCLLIAAKIEETDLKIPKISRINSDQLYTNDEFRAVEVFVLTFFEWSVITPTAAHFLELYNYRFASDQDLPKSNSSISDMLPYDFTDLVEIESVLCKLSFDYLDLSLSDMKMMNAVPSKLACACIAAARSTIRLMPVWPDRLAAVTRYQLEAIETLVSLLVVCRLESTEQHNCVNLNKRKHGDSGYLSDDCRYEPQVESSIKMKTMLA